MNQGRTITTALLDVAPVRRFTGFACGIGCLVAVPEVWGATYVVRPDGSGDFPTISAAVQAAQNGDEILLGDGTFTGDENRNVVVELKDLVIRSESGDPSRCTIDCSKGLPEVSRAFVMYRTETVVEGITFTGGNSVVAGAIVSWQSTMTIGNCVFTANEAQRGFRSRRELSDREQRGNDVSRRGHLLY